MENEYSDFTNAIQTDQTMTAEIGKLALALSKAQGAITGALKDSKNPFFKSNYADLGNVLAACRGPLSENELAVIQTTEPHDKGVVIISTLVHSSGQWIRGKLRMTPTKPDPQGVGSALTYARRYAYAALIGVAQVDDDGNQASDKHTKVNDDGQASEPIEKITDSQALELEAMITDNGIDTKRVKAWMAQTLKVNSFADINVNAYEGVKHKIEATIKAKS